MALTMDILSKETDAIGTDKYRSTDATIPMAFRQTLTHLVKPNPDGSNHQSTITASVPVVVTIDGVSTSKDTYRAIFKFSSLQHIVNDAERAQAYDLLIKYLSSAPGKAAIIGGVLPKTPIALALA